MLLRREEYQAVGNREGTGKQSHLPFDVKAAGKNISGEKGKGMEISRENQWGLRKNIKLYGTLYTPDLRSAVLKLKARGRMDADILNTVR